jgi:hypothetical protein
MRKPHCYKAENVGRIRVAINPRGISQRCSQCRARRQHRRGLMEAHDFSRGSSHHDLIPL